MMTDHSTILMARPQRPLMTDRPPLIISRAQQASASEPAVPAVVDEPAAALSLARAPSSGEAPAEPPPNPEPSPSGGNPHFPKKSFPNANLGAYPTATAEGAPSPNDETISDDALRWASVAPSGWSLRGGRVPMGPNQKPTVL